MLMAGEVFIVVLVVLAILVLVIFSQTIKIVPQKIGLVFAPQ